MVFECLDLGPMVVIWSNGFVVDGHNENQLLSGEKQRSINRNNGEFGFRLD